VFGQIKAAGGSADVSLGSDETAGLGFEQVVRLELSPEQRTGVRLTVADEMRWRGEVIAYARTARPSGSSREISASSESTATSVSGRGGGGATGDEPAKRDDH
jgi:hypothetical protein